MSRRLQRYRVRTLLLWATPLAAIGCGGGGTDVVVPSLSITTSTSGVEVDADGYSLVVDGAGGEAIGVNATVMVERLQDGLHTVGLAGLASNCAATGENPRPVTVTSGSTASVDFAIICSATSGTIEVATATTGPGSDPDGFMLLLDGSERGPIGISATASLPGLTPGSHAVGLTGLAGNCQVVGENPRGVTVTPGQTAQVPFAVTCASPEPTTGTLEITTSTSGSDQDADGYRIVLDGGTGQPIGPNARLTLANVSAASHRIELLGMAPNCSVGGDNPRNLTVVAGQTITVAFSINCGSTAGGLTITISGLPAGATAAVTVAGPNNYSQTVSGTRTLTGLVAGTYNVTATNVTAGGVTYTPTIDRSTVSVAAGGTAAVAVNYRRPAGATLNLRIAGLYLTQSTQTRDGNVPLIRDRAAFLRVFVVGSETNTARPGVRVRFYRDGSLARTITIPAPGSSSPTQVQESTLGSSWNARVDASLMRPETSILADVDPANTVAEANENDNTFPGSGTPQLLPVRAVPPAAIRFVPVLQTANGLEGEVGNATQLIELARRMFPLGSVQTDVRSVYTATGPLEPDNANHAWNQVLSDIEALRVTDGSDWTYYGVVKLDYVSGIVGNGFVGLPSAIGTDNPFDARRVLAHELGHTWGRFHSPCGNPGGLDPDEAYPYPNGEIGVYGFDAVTETLKSPATADIMGYCPNPWISDHTFQRVMTYRQAHPNGASTAGLSQPCVLVWGRIEEGRPVLEPAFRVVTRPALPARPGPYSVEAKALDGSTVFNLSFDATPVGDDPRGSRHFAFAVPLDQARAAGLVSLRLAGPGGAGATSSLRTAQLRKGVTPDSIVARREAGEVGLKWNASVHPMIIVRDPDTGEVLSFARGGAVKVRTNKGEIDLDVSDGVQSHRVRLAISRS